MLCVLFPDLRLLCPDKNLISLTTARGDAYTESFLMVETWTTARDRKIELLTTARGDAYAEYPLKV